MLEDLEFARAPAIMVREHSTQLANLRLPCARCDGRLPLQSEIVRSWRKFERIPVADGFAARDVTWCTTIGRRLAPLIFIARSARFC